MTAQEMWDAYRGDQDPVTCPAWQFGVEPDQLAALVLTGVKTATSSLYHWYQAAGEPLPQVGEYQILEDSRGKAVCVLQTTAVSIVPYDRITADHAWKEGEGDRSLAHWRQVHRAFFTQELADVNLPFSEQLAVVCEEFTVVYSAQD